MKKNNLHSEAEYQRIIANLRAAEEMHRLTVLKLSSTMPLTYNEVAELQLLLFSCEEVYSSSMNELYSHFGEKK